MVRLFVLFALVAAVHGYSLLGGLAAFLQHQTPVSAQPVCGVRKVVTDYLIIGGSNAKRGEWPWHAAVYLMSKNGTIEEYKCGGTLISNRFVLTTASCGRIGVDKPPGTIRVALGQHSLLEQSIHTTRVPVAKVIVHEEYIPGEIMNDVALLEFADPIQYTDYIQPACLPKSSDRIENYDNLLGTIIGWGYTNSNNLAEELQTAKAPVIPFITCLESNPHFFSKVLYAGMYCAGYTNGTTACFGDAGGGMFFQNSTTWTLRGMISFTDRSYSSICNTEHYFGLVNVVHFLPWIEDRTAAVRYQNNQAQRNPVTRIPSDRIVLT